MEYCIPAFNAPLVPRAALKRRREPRVRLANLNRRLLSCVNISLLLIDCKVAGIPCAATTKLANENRAVPPVSHPRSRRLYMRAPRWVQVFEPRCAQSMHKRRRWDTLG